MTHTFTRRAMLAGAAGLAAFARGRASDPIQRTRPSHLKLSLAAYSYRQYLTGDAPRMNLFAFADLAADLRVDAIEPTSYYFPPDVDSGYLQRLQRHAFLLGLDISGTAIGNDFCVAEGPAQSEQIERTKMWIDRAADLHAPVIRTFAGSTPKGDTDAAALERVVAAYKEVLPYAAERGIMLALENHGGITSTPDQMLKLIEAIDHPNFGVNLDSGNFHTEDPYADLARIAPYAVNVQIKTEVSRAGKKEEADLARLVGILREAKYSGYVALEYEAAEDCLTAIPRYVERLRKLIA